MKDKNLSDKLKELDQVDLETSWSEKDLWDTIESRLEEQNDPRRLRTIGLNALPWAALVLFALGLYWWSSASEPGTIEVVAIEVETDLVIDLTNDDHLTEGKNFILEACRKEMEICDSPSFLMLYEELSRIEEEKILLSETVKQYGADEIVARALIQLENAESSITSQLISMIVI